MMTTIDEAVRGLISIVVDLCAVRICERLYKADPILLLFCDVISKAT